MKVRPTSDEIRRITFVDNLYKQMRIQTQSAIDERDHMVTKASAYLEDGVTDSECAELLVIDGIDRVAAENYVQVAKEDVIASVGQHEYSFQFEDVYGKIWSSHDINHTVHASSDQNAWELAETKVFADPSIEPERIISVDRIV